MFNSLERRSETWMIERQNSAVRLLSAAMHRKALFDIEERGRSTTNQSNSIAALAAGAVFCKLSWKQSAGGQANKTPKSSKSFPTAPPLA